MCVCVYHHMHVCWFWAHPFGKHYNDFFFLHDFLNFQQLFSSSHWMLMDDMMNSLKFKEEKNFCMHAFKIEMSKKINEKYLKNHLKRVSWKIHKGQLNEQWTNNDSSSDGKKSLCVYLNITLGMMAYAFCLLLLFLCIEISHRNCDDDGE